MSLAQDFFDLFKGSDIAHGTFVVNGSRVGDGKTALGMGLMIMVMRYLQKNLLHTLERRY
jgi:hypothetical protein